MTGTCSSRANPFAAGNLRNFLLPVVRVAAAAGNQLNVVDQDDGQTVFGLKLAAFGMNLGNPHVRGIVDKDLRRLQIRGRFIELIPFVVIEKTGAQLAARNPAFSRKHTGDQLLGRHFQRKDRCGLMVELRDLHCDV